MLPVKVASGDQEGDQTPVSERLFEIFIRYLYYGVEAFDGSINLSAKDRVYLCECADFYELSDSETFKATVQRLK